MAAPTPIPGAGVPGVPGVFPLRFKNDVWFPNGVKLAGLSQKTRAKLIDLVTVPKRRQANIRKRYAIQERCARDQVARQIVQEVCAQSPLYWLNMFGWTYRPKMVCSDGIERTSGTVWFDDQGRRRVVPPADTPIITWPAQDALVLEIRTTIRHGGLLVEDKSRDQGATVINMATLTHAMLYEHRFSALVVSAKEDLVESPGEDSLMGKIDYVLKWLPPWMIDLSAITRVRKPSFISYRVTGSRIIGETSTVNTGQSHRVSIALVDEAARFPHGETLQKSLDTVSAGQLWSSTPNGPLTTFAKLAKRAETAEGRAGGIRKFTLGYWDHPQKGAGRTWTIDRDGTVTGKADTGYWETPAFKVARARATSIKDIRENWLIQHDTSGLAVIDSNAISRARPACRIGRIGRLIPSQNGEGFEFLDDPNGRLTLWCELDENGKPRADTNYVQGWDFGQGVEASNTIGEVMDRDTGVLVAEYADPTIAPHEAAGVAMAMGVFFGGQVGYAFIIWERNGPGMGFGHEIVKRRYPYLYYQRDEDKRGAKAKRTWGWQSTGASREILFSNLDRALRSGEVITYNELALDDMAAWFFDEYGRIVCGTVRDLKTGAQERHGDRAIACALVVMGRKEAPLYEPERLKLPPNSLGAIAGMNEEFDDNPPPRAWYRK